MKKRKNEKKKSKDYCLILYLKTRKMSSMKEILKIINFMVLEFINGKTAIVFIRVNGQWGRFMVKENFCGEMAQDILGNIIRIKSREEAKLFSLISTHGKANENKGKCMEKENCFIKLIKPMKVSKLKVKEVKRV